MLGSEFRPCVHSKAHQIDGVACCLHAESSRLKGCASATRGTTVRKDKIRLGAPLQKEHGGQSSESPSGIRRARCAPCLRRSGIRCRNTE
jgi:hypothetical protein